MSDQTKGILALIACCVMWGVSMMYYKLLSHVPPLEVLAWRTCASVVMFAVVLGVQGRLGQLRIAARQPRVVGVVCLASLMIGVNWFGFIFSIQSGQAVQSSLGYYIFPLVAVVVGRVVFHERLSPVQWAAVALAAVAGLAYGLGTLPWISLLLAVTFAFYGALKKTLPLGPMVSVMAEVCILAPIGAVYMWGFGNGLNWDWPTLILLFLAGPVTGTPLILFSYGARRVRMSTLGLVQYLNPTLQFVVATQVFREPFTIWHAIAFPMIWTALAIYSFAALRQDKTARNASRAPSTVSSVRK